MLVLFQCLSQDSMLVFQCLSQDSKTPCNALLGHGRNLCTSIVAVKTHYVQPLKPWDGPYDSVTSGYCYRWLT